MASTSKCPFCGGVVRSNERTCPHCGAENKLYIEDTPRTIHRPRTIDELKEYCAERGMPLLRMRFFIGEDFKEPRAFGIYRDGKNVVVYKNKADGSRAIRYRGPDEEHGVNELFQKLLDECHNRGIYPDGKPVTRSADGSGSSRSSQPEPEPELPLPAGETAPRTLDELRERCAEKNISLERLRFVLGSTNRRNFSGIVLKEGKTCIYRVKEDGSRVYSYQSEDEAEAIAKYYSMILGAADRAENPPVNSSGKKKSRRKQIIRWILAFPFLVILGIVPIWIYIIDLLICAILRKNGTWPSECQKELDAESSLFRRLWKALGYSFRYGPNSCLSGRVRKNYLWISWIAPLVRVGLAITLVVCLILSISALVHRNDGYYQASDNTVYYRDGGDWYVYDPDGGAYDWYEVDNFPDDNAKDYLMDTGWENDWDGTSFSDGSVWSEPSSSSSDSGDSWSSSDYGSWDSGGTDWSSDW